MKVLFSLFSLNQVSCVTIAGMTSTGFLCDRQILRFRHLLAGLFCLFLQRTHLCSVFIQSDKICSVIDYLYSSLFSSSSKT